MFGVARQWAPRALTRRSRATPLRALSSSPRELRARRAAPSAVEKRPPEA